MKIIILSLFAFATINLFAQDSTVSLSKYEQFLSNSGRMIKTELFDIDGNKSYKIQINKSTDLQNGSFVKAVTITQQKNFFLIGNVSTGVLYIDWDEFPEYLKGVKFIQSQLDSKPERATTYQYSTINGVTASAIFQTEVQPKGWSIYFGQVYKYSRQFRYSFFLPLKDISDLVKMLESVEKTTL